MLERGPISKRKILPKERLKKIVLEIEEDKKILKRQTYKWQKEEKNLEENCLHYLPPIVSDYSGACSALFSPEILKILISPGGCKTPVIEDEIRDIDNNFLFCTTFNEIEVIVGNIDQLWEEIEKILKLYPKISFVAIIKTTISNLLELDCSFLIKKIENTYKKTVILVNTNGFHSYYKGIQMVYKEIARKIMKKEEMEEKTVNILGYTPLTHGKISNLQEIFLLLQSLNVKIKSIFSFNLSLEKIKSSTKASLNLVLSYEGLELAIFMKEKFEIPYYIVNPVGIYGMRKLQRYLQEYFGNSTNFNYTVNVSKKKISKKILVISSPMMALHICETLQSDFVIEKILALSFLMIKKEREQMFSCKHLKDLKIVESEKELQNLVLEYSPDVIIGDLIYAKILKKVKKFIPVIHYGYSTKIYQNIEYEYCGKKGYEYLKKFLYMEEW